MALPIIRIPLPKHFSFTECIWFLDRNLNDCLHTILGNSIVKLIYLNQQPLLIQIKESDGYLAVTVLKGFFNDQVADLLQAYIQEWFDLPEDLTPFYALLQQDARLAYMVKAFNGLRLMGIPDLFEALCWCIIGQQINLTFAHVLKRRLVERYGNQIVHEDRVYYSFPSAEVLAKVTPNDLRAMQFSGQKATYLIHLAQTFITGQVSKAKLQRLPTLADRQQALMNLKGVGIWTANYVLMKSLREPTCIPFGDAGLLNALRQHGIIQDKKDQVGLSLFFKSFNGFESYLVFYLWRSLAVKK